MLCRNQSRKQLHATLRNDEVMIAAAEGLTATFYDAQAASLRAVGRSELVEMRDAVGNAVNGTVETLGG